MGIIRKLFGGRYSERAWRDQWRPSTVGKNLVSPINDYGHCFSCEGAGERLLECRGCRGTGVYSGDCRKCNGTGVFVLEARECWCCRGSGAVNGTPCRKCMGDGLFKPQKQFECLGCGGTGLYTAGCRRCGGDGSIKVTCRKCEGTGWHKF